MQENDVPTEMEYRVIADDSESESGDYDYFVTEVYYFKGQVEPHSFLREPDGPFGNSLMDLKNDIQKMANALNKPVLYLEGDKLVTKNQGIPHRVKKKKK